MSRAEYVTIAIVALIAGTFGALRTLEHAVRAPWWPYADFGLLSARVAGGFLGDAIIAATLAYAWVLFRRRGR